MHRKSVGFKTLTITCLALALISTITLNIIRTYSINNTRTNALWDSSLGSSTATTSQGSAATLANDANPISISLSNATGSSDPTSGNISITTPTGGGIATGSHTVTIHTSSLVSGYNVTIHSSGGDTDLVPSDFGTSESSNNNLIEPAGGSANPAPLANPTTLANNQWGVALPGSTLYPNKYSNTNDYTSTNQTTLANTKYAAIPGKGSSDDQDSTILTKNSPANQATGDSTTIYYGVKVSPSIQADTYSAEVTYTATAILPPAPELNTITPNTFYLTSGHDGTVKIKGSNTPTPLSNITNIYLDLNGNGTMDSYEECRDLTTDAEDTTNSTLICTMPTDTYLQYLGETTILSNLTTTNNGNGTGTYPIRLIHTSGDTATNLTYSYRNPSGQIPTTSSTNLPTGTNGTTNRTMSICRNGDPSSDCQVDIDDNMIPVKYVGTHKEPKWAVVTNSEQSTNKGLWYNYSVGETATQGGGAKWANAVTVQSDKLATYKQAKQGNNPNVVVDNNDILGYYTYVPRYAYEVQRPNAVDRVVSPQNFNIHFETATDTKKTPAETCNTLNITNPNQMWDNDTPTAEAGPDNTNILAKDYRTACVNESGGTITRTYGSATGTTWATHPAFTFGSTELNGLWVGKFETTGTVANPTVKPNQHANIYEYIGEFYTMAKHIGAYDPSNTGGNDITANDTTLNATGQWTSLHNLSTATSHMLKNSEWGAITYLASSRYGAGTNNVSINSAYPSTSADADGRSSRYGITGCGPNNLERSTATYTDGTPLSASTIESATACSTDPELGSRRAYNGDIGQLASTTNNVYGIYDMSGGANEYVMGNLTGYDDQSESNNTSYTKNPIKPPYVDLYKESLGFDSTSSDDTNPAWSYSTNARYYNNDVCTWGTCGGHALHETKQYQSVSSSGQSWGGDYSLFVHLSTRWFLRGGLAGNGSGAGLFYSSDDGGGTGSSYGFRSVLLAAP